MSDSDSQTRNPTTGKPEGRNTIRIPPRLGRGPRTTWLTNYIKYEDYSYLDDGDDDDEIIIDPAKYSIGPSGRPIAGSKRVAAALQREHGSSLSMPESTAANPTIGINNAEGMRPQSMVATGTPPGAVDSAQAPWSNNPQAFHAFHNGVVDESHRRDATMSYEAVMEG